MVQWVGLVEPVAYVKIPHDELLRRQACRFEMHAFCVIAIKKRLSLPDENSLVVGTSPACDQHRLHRNLAHLLFCIRHQVQHGIHDEGARRWKGTRIV